MDDGFALNVYMPKIAKHGDCEMSFPFSRIFPYLS